MTKNQINSQITTLEAKMQWVAADMLRTLSQTNEQSLELLEACCNWLDAAASLASVSHKKALISNAKCAREILTRIKENN